MNDLVVLEKIAQWEKLKTLVLDSVSSPITRQVYNLGLNKFFDWYGEAPRLGFTKATVRASDRYPSTCASLRCWRSSESVAF